ncbi:hypothetical protein [Dactylosporangium salmoneum]|uniref:Tat (Twin-arginine translocation) pathway signal sequence n=1 Tax=Dactylosporangium salmoneum TaxID=53361 RepID=A0ABP5ST30_9ACTN
MHALLSRHAGRALTGLVLALVAAFVLAPGPLAAAGPGGGGLADQGRLSSSLRGAFLEYWRSGDRDLPPDLTRVVDFWFRYHVVKGAIAALLLVALAGLGVVLYRRYLRPGRRAATVAAGVFVWLLGLLALATVMANVQGAVAPFASLLPILASGAPDGPLADALAQTRQRLAEGGHYPPAVQAMVADFGRYHEAMAVIAAVVAVALIAASVLLWRRFALTARSDVRARRGLRALGAASALASLAVLVVVVANTTVAADPAPALLAFFDGGW